MRILARLAMDYGLALVVAIVVLLASGCSAVPKRLPACPVADAQAVSDGKKVYAVFDYENLAIFRDSIAANARGECEYRD